MFPGTSSGSHATPLEEAPLRRSRPCRLVLQLALPAALALALMVVVPAPSGAQSQEPLARTSQITDAKEQLDFGVKMARRGLWSEALFRFKQARRLDPGNPRILNNMAVAYEALGHFDKALETYQEAVRLQSTNRDLRKNYSRFVEFYRAFRPDEQKDASLDESSATAANDNDAEALEANDSTANDSTTKDSAANDNEPTADDAAGSNA